jgi:hypothetical protein
MAETALVRGFTREAWQRAGNKFSRVSRNYIEMVVSAQTCGLRWSFAVGKTPCKKEMEMSLIYYERERERESARERERESKTRANLADN